MRHYLNKELMKSVISLASVIEARDPYTGGHTWRVSQYASKLALEANVSENDHLVVQLGALVHDIGKVAISDAILLKKESLTEDEYKTMKKHPIIGIDLLKFHPLFPLLEDAVHNHHKRVDGKGYPEGEQTLSVVSRIISIADAFDAMTSNRPYRDAMTKDKAMNILIGEKGLQFDAQLVELFLELDKKVS